MINRIKNSLGGPAYGDGGSAMPPSGCATKFSDPPLPPTDDGGGGGGGDNWGDNWDKGRQWFPMLPPMGDLSPESPYEVLDVKTINPRGSMVLVCAAAIQCRQLLPFRVPNTPPPAAVGFWVFPVTHYELQRRVYYRQPGAAPANVSLADCNRKELKKLGYKPSIPVLVRIPVFQFGDSGDLLSFDARRFDTPFTDWALVPGSLDPAARLMAAVNRSVHRILNPVWLSQAESPYREELIQRFQAASDSLEVMPVSDPFDFDCYDGERHD